jgi:hypothetical protein
MNCGVDFTDMYSGLGLLELCICQFFVIWVAAICGLHLLGFPFYCYTTMAQPCVAGFHFAVGPLYLCLQCSLLYYDFKI